MGKKQLTLVCFLGLLFSVVVVTSKLKIYSHCLRLMTDKNLKTMTQPDIIQTILKESVVGRSSLQSIGRNSVESLSHSSKPISSLKSNRKSLNPLTYASTPKTFWNMQSEQSKSLLNKTSKLLSTGWNLFYRDFDISDVRTSCILYVPEVSSLCS